MDIFRKCFWANELLIWRCYGFLERLWRSKERLVLIDGSGLCSLNARPPHLKFIYIYLR